VKRILLVFLFGLAALAGALFAWRDALAERLVRRAMRDLEGASIAQGVVVRDLGVKRVGMVGLRTIVCEDVAGTVHLGGVWPAESSVAAVRAAQAVVRFAGVFGGRVELAVYGGEAAPSGRGDAPDLGLRVSDITAEAAMDVSWRRPVDAVRAAAEEVRALVRTGRCRLRGSFRGTARFRVGEQWQEARLRTETMQGVLTMVVEPDDVRRISRSYEHPLTEAEMEIVAQHPFRVPTMLALAERATVAARDRRRRERTFPEDAYRHVLWSWLLTREFGPEFSEQVTDAHEIGATYEFGSANRRMDLRNNAVGRAYALAGVPEAALVERVLTDPNVQRAP
jgi:hypothetical protein